METSAPYLTTIEPQPQTNGLNYRQRAELWRQLCAHLIGLATVLWRIYFNEVPPK